MLKIDPETKQPMRQPISIFIFVSLEGLRQGCGSLFIIYESGSRCSILKMFLIRILKFRMPHFQKKLLNPLWLLYHFKQFRTFDMEVPVFFTWEKKLKKVKKHDFWVISHIFSKLESNFNTPRILTVPYADSDPSIPLSWSDSCLDPHSVVDPVQDPDGSETFSRIRIRSEMNLKENFYKKTSIFLTFS